MNVLLWELIIAGEAFQMVTSAFEALSKKDEDVSKSRRSCGDSSAFHKFFKGKVKSEGPVMEADSDEESDTLEPSPVRTPSPKVPSSKSESIYYGPPPPKPVKSVVLEYTEWGTPRISFRDISPERQEGARLKMGVPTFKPKVVGRM